MYNKLPVKERIELMKSYRKANKDMSYRDMVKDYNDSYEKFRDGGIKEDDVPKTKRDATVGISGLSPFIAYNPGKDPYGQYKGEIERANYINNINSKGYKSRLQRELFGDVQGPITGLEDEILNRELKTRAHNVNAVGIEIGESENPNAAGQYYPMRHHITTETNPTSIYHELSHASNEAQPGEGFKKKYLELLKANGFKGDNVRGLDYFKRPTEVQARLNSLRLKAIEDGTYNNDEDFNIEKNDSYPERGYQELKNETGLSDAQIEELMKSSAYIPGKNYQLSIARYGGVQQFGNGGKSDGMTGLMKSKIATEAHYGNPAALRMVSPNPKTGITPEGIGTHYMSSFDNYAVPLLQDKGNKNLEYIENPPISKEDIRFNSPEEAQYFAEHYKEVAPMMRNWEKHKYGGIQKFRNGGKKAFQQFRNTDMSDSFSSNINNQNTDLREYDFNNLPPRQGPLAFVYPDTYKDNQIAKQNIQESVQEKTQEPTQEFEKKPVQEPVKKNKEPVKTQDTVKERYQAFFPNPAKTSNETLTSTPTYYGGKEQNMSQYPMTTAQKLIYKAKKAAEADRQYNFAKALTNVAGFIPGSIGLGANILAGSMDIAKGDYNQGIVQGAATALRNSQDKKAQVIKGLSNLITGKELYDYSETPAPTYLDMLRYYTDEYKRELLKPQLLTKHKYGGIQKINK